jgi:3-hydroxyacyl-[acyl-carrier-protein] dehydratase
MDDILEQSADRIVAIKQVSLAEEYLADHFPSFPVLPGVLMIEAMVQAARALMAGRDANASNLVLGEVKALKFGNMVRPGESLKVDVSLVKANDDGTFQFKAVGTVLRPNRPGSDDTAVSGKFTLRPVKRD